LAAHHLSHVKILRASLFFSVVTALAGRLTLGLGRLQCLVGMVRRAMMLRTAELRKSKIAS
jgi:hypothetical protein